MGYAKRVKQFHPEQAFMTLLRAHNVYDVRLHELSFTLWNRNLKYRLDPCAGTRKTKITRQAPVNHEHTNDVLRFGG